MAGERDYRITVENTVTVNQAGSTVVGGATIPPNPLVQSVGVESTSTMTTIDPTTSKTFGTGRAISAHFFVGAATRLLNASGNQQIAQTVGDIGRYAFLGARALAMDPTAIASLALDVATNAWEMARKNAEDSNKDDEAMIRAGLMNLNGITVRKEFWTGRYVYSRD